MSHDPSNKANGAAPGGGHAHEGETISPDSHLRSATPEAVEDLAAACERFVLVKYGVRLDRRRDTLSVLDQYVRDARAEVLVKPESLPLLQAAIGAYYGEVVRGEFEAAWFTEGDHDGWRLDLARVYLTFNPIGLAREALLLEEAEGWHAFLEMDDAEREEVEARLIKLPQVEDEEFYLPTTRFEVLEIAIDAIRVQMEERGLGDVTFGPEDYKK